MMTNPSGSICKNSVSKFLPFHRFFRLITLLACAAAVPAMGQGLHKGERSVTLWPALSFSTLTTTVSAPQVVTLTNTGISTVHVYGVSITGAAAADFVQSSSCVGILHGGDSCSMTVTFASTTPGTFSAALAVSDDVDSGTQSVALTGTAAVPAPVVTLSTNSINFAPLTAGTTSGAQTVTLTNTGTAVLNLGSIGLTGTGTNLFNETNTCGATVAINASCTISVNFAPLVPGSYSAAISIADDANDSPQGVSLSGAATPAQLTIDTTNAADWKISNGTITIDWNSQGGNIFGMYLVGHSDNLVDVTNTSGGIPKGLYMDNSGFGSATPTAAYTNNGNYLDWSITYPSNSKNAYTYSEHFVVFPNDPGIHVYFVANHATTDIAGSIGQVQWVFRDNLAQFTNTYTVDEGLNNPGVQIVPLPDSSLMFSSAAGRYVQDATTDLHGFTLPAGFTREFYTKYDYSSYEYLHKAHGLFGSTYGTWAVMQSPDTLVGGPTKQDLIYTGNLLIVEAYSNHLDNGITLATPSGTASSRLFGPFYIRINTFGQAYSQTGET
ncbi:MAG TPA: choice-of-anchor D domain-containing protein, partial [Edaphobacter sp.]